ncbi:MAG: hypothetical protein JST89_15435 [Cyanobacteria bacterium SZAS-4]|nr:hypothetical protein [Cyanobacteria bacterium SZAS-4]
MPQIFDRNVDVPPPLSSDSSNKFALEALRLMSSENAAEPPVGKPAEMFIAAPLDKPVEVKVKTEAEKFEQADPLTKTSTILGRLPNFKISFTDKSLTVETPDFAKLIEATPGITLAPEVRDVVSAVKGISFSADDKFTLDLKDVAKLKIDRTVPVVGKVTDLVVGDRQKQVKFDVEFDAKNTDKVAIKNITGIALAIEGKEPLAIRSLALDTSGDKARLKVTVDNPVSRPKLIDEKKWPKTVSTIIELDALAPGMNADFFKGVVKTLSDSKTALLNKDASMLLSGLPDEGIRTKLIDMAKNLKRVEKDGDNIIIERAGGVTEHQFGGPTLSLSPLLQFKLKTAGGGIEVSDLRGIEISSVIPQVGLGDKVSAGITGVSLSPKYGDSRALTIKSDRFIDSVKVRLRDSDLLPATDANGDWRLDIRMTNPLDVAGTAKINLPLKFNQAGSLNMSTGEIAAVASDVVRSGAKSNIVKAVQVLDNTTNQVIGGVERKANEVRAVANVAKSIAANEVRNIIDYWTK